MWYFTGQVLIPSMNMEIVLCIIAEYHIEAETNALSL